MYFEFLNDGDLEQVVLCRDGPSGLRAVIAVHSTRLGPAIGGCRFFPYDREVDAVWDAVRLAEGMTYKAAAAGLDCGGGKAVIIGDPEHSKTEALLRAFGRYVDTLGGRYVTAEDVGTTVADMDTIRRETPHVVGISPGLGGSGDPSPVTAAGVLAGMRAAAAHRWGTPTLADRHVAVMGVGKVGSALAHRLHEAGARLSIADTNRRVAETVAAALGCAVVSPDEILFRRCHVLAPCAMGGILSDDVVNDLQTEIICGSANNQLATESVADTLAKHEILYAPDFIVNAGGLISVAVEMEGHDREVARARVEGIERTTADLLHRADTDVVSTAVAARHLAEERIDALARVALIRTPA